ncbi:hypothetical protein ABZ726_22670, partial [Streptomyces hundungensis]|uniref:hypothetical protein n=1 Tax=Streptomyces hundungensis TaxID=1077946 RepID=UPI0033DA906F
MNTSHEEALWKHCTASGVELSTEEFRKEQQFITGLYARLDELRDQAEAATQTALAQVGTGQQARLERDVLVAE